MMALVLTLLSLSLLPAPAAEQRLGRAVCRLWLNKSVPLSGVLKVRMTIEGPDPVDVEVPSPLINSPDWRVRPEPPSTSRRGEAGQVWEQTFFLEPFQVGNVALPLQPIRFRTGNEVRDWELTWPTQSVQVHSSITEPELGAARPPAGIEKVPAPQESSNLALLIGATLAVAVIGTGFAFWYGLRKGDGTRAALSPRDRALAEVARLEPGDGPLPEQLPQLADVLRQFLEEQFQLAATRQTTGEFHVTLRAANVLSEAEIATVAEILSRCDLVKFAGARPDREACQGLLRRARALIAEAGSAGQKVLPA